MFLILTITALVEQPGSESVDVYQFTVNSGNSGKNKIVFSQFINKPQSDLT